MIVGAVVAFFGILHHLDHVIRGNHVGWPLTTEVNAFTYSLIMEPLVLLGLYFTWHGHLGPRYWLGVGLAGLIAAGPTHIGPWAVEPPSDIYLPYADPIFYCQTTAPANRIDFFTNIYGPIASPFWAVLAIIIMLNMLIALLVMVIVALQVYRRERRL
jgi:hypothetical protein